MLILWRTHSRVPYRHTSRYKVPPHRTGVEKSFDAARTSACATLLFAILTAGCGHAPMAYSLMADGPHLLVRPPVPANREITIKNARTDTCSNCDIESGFATLNWQGRTARVRLHSTQIQDFSDKSAKIPADIPNHKDIQSVVQGERVYMD